MIPNEEQAMGLHRKYGSNERIVSHCKACARLSKLLCEKATARGHMVNSEAAVAGALLHDIGRTRTQTVDHGYVGAEILRGEGVHGIVVEIVKRHVGAGISSEEATALGFPPGDYVPKTLAEKIVCFSDKMLDGDKARPFDEEVKRFVAKGHDVQRLKRLKSDVAVAVGGDPEEMVLSAGNPSS
jgi:uncharacterized protein (TIGR00295 family)